MDEKIKIGIPRGLLYYKYHVLWEEFFRELNCDLVISKETDFEILNMGKKLSIDECCLSLKIFIGHVNYLTKKVDYILIPRIVCIKENTEMCTNFYALYDIVNNTFNTKILSYNVDLKKGITEEDAFLKMGESLGFGKNYVLSAYHNAKKEEYKNNKINYLLQSKRLKRKSTKILLVSHSYNAFDNLIGKQIVNLFNDLNVEVIYACINNIDDESNSYKKISKNLRWLYNMELLSSIIEYKNDVHGIVILSSFPCGPDSLVNEMIERNVDKKIITILMDNPVITEGIKTRIESFVEIIREEKYE